MKFGEAITLLNAGHKVTRLGWNGKGMWLFLIVGNHWETTRGLEMLEGRPWVGIKTVDNQFMPWVASQSDMLADDWMISTEPTGETTVVGAGTVSKPKNPKLHWTQTPEGKKIMASRKRKGKK